MTNNIRVFLWLGLGLALWLNYTTWQAEFAPKINPTAAGTTGADGSKPVSLGDTVPQAVQQAAPQSVEANAVPAAPVAPEAAASATPASVPSAGRVKVVTDVLTMGIDLRGGTLVYAELPGYPVVKGKPEPMVLLYESDPTTNYFTLQTGLAGQKADDVRPTHVATFSSASSEYRLAAGTDEIRVPLTWTDGGVTVTKTFVFHRSSFIIGVEQSVHNGSPAPWTAASYARLMRVDPKVEHSMFKVESFAYRGPAIFDPAGDKYQKLDIEKSENQNRSFTVQDGWLAGMQHHFASVIIPHDRKAPYTYTLQSQGRLYILGALGPAVTVKPGETTLFKEDLFVGPKLQKQLVSLHPELDRVADYGWLALLSRPLFWMLDHAHALVKNWGLSIILITFLLKLLFYPLAQYSGKSMARMRTLTPRIKNLQETYKDDREKLGRAMMDLYKTEKVNPVSGCLPMLIQMPVFLAFYWVLLESVEMRQAPFFGWINDLSARDPFFILPALNGLAMWGQYKLNPPPPDPVQAKVFQFMPIVFSIMFALFPAGLVLYWVTNTGLSILQQWNINRNIAADDRKRRA